MYSYAIYFKWHNTYCNYYVKLAILKVVYESNVSVAFSITSTDCVFFFFFCFVFCFRFDLFCFVFWFSCRELCSNNAQTCLPLLCQERTTMKHYYTMQSTSVDFVSNITHFAWYSCTIFVGLACIFSGFTLSRLVFWCASSISILSLCKNFSALWKFNFVIWDCVWLQMFVTSLLLVWCVSFCQTCQCYLILFC